MPDLTLTSDLTLSSRSISLFRTSYSFVAACRPLPDHLALLWFAQYAPSASSYAPFYVAAQQVGH